MTIPDIWRERESCHIICIQAYHLTGSWRGEGRYLNESLKRSRLLKRLGGRMLLPIVSWRGQAAGMLMHPPHTPPHPLPASVLLVEGRGALGFAKGIRTAPLASYHSMRVHPSPCNALYGLLGWGGGRVRGKTREINALHCTATLWCI